MKFVIIGLGSIGLRHKNNLEILGHEVASCHHDDDLEEKIETEKPNGVLICNLTSQHLKTALQLIKFDLPIFIEKPLSHNLDNIDQLKGNILVGYCLRFDRSLIEFKQKINQEKIQSVKIVCKSWLPDWHPNTDYRQSYSAKKDLGGGVLLDLSHEIDYALWFFGQVKLVKAKLQSAPELNIETKAVADLDLEFQNNIRVKIYLSYASHEPKRYCEIKFKGGKILRWDYQTNNEIYIEEMKHFIKVCQGKEAPLITVTDGINVLKVIENAKINQI